MSKKEIFSPVSVTFGIDYIFPGRFVAPVPNPIIIPYYNIVDTETNLSWVRVKQVLYFYDQIPSEVPTMLESNGYNCRALVTYRKEEPYGNVEEVMFFKIIEPIYDGDFLIFNCVTGKAAGFRRNDVRACSDMIKFEDISLAARF